MQYLHSKRISLTTMLEANQINQPVLRHHLVHVMTALQCDKVERKAWGEWFLQKESGRAAINRSFIALIKQLTKFTFFSKRALDDFCQRQ